MTSGLRLRGKFDYLALSDQLTSTLFKVSPTKLEIPYEDLHW